MDQTEAYRQKKERKAIIQLTLIVGSYLFGYLPSSGKFVGQIRLLTALVHTELLSLS